MASGSSIPDFKAKSARDREALGREGVERLFRDAARFPLAPVVEAGGSIVLPHATISTCGHQIAAAVRACLESGAKKVVALGVVHALSDELRSARERVAAGGRLDDEPTRGVQGPGIPGRADWQREFSLDHFAFLWKEALRLGICTPGTRESSAPGTSERSALGTSEPSALRTSDLSALDAADPPVLVLRYVFLAGGRPDTLPGIDALREEVEGAVLVATADPFHHGIGYGDTPEAAKSPDAGGLGLAREAIERAMSLLEAGDYAEFEAHCAAVKSDARDTGQVLRYLAGPQRATILDLVADDMTGPYGAPAPTWVAGALIGLTPI